MSARPNRPREYTQEQRQEALRLVKKLGLSAAARQLGYPLQTVAFWKNGRKPKVAAEPETADVAPTPVKAAEVEPSNPPAYSSAPEPATASSKLNVAKSYKPSLRARVLEYAAEHGVTAAAREFGVTRFSIYDW